MKRFLQKMLSFIILVILFLSFKTCVVYCDEATEDNSKTHHRVRRFIFTRDSKVTFDLELTLPIPMLGGVDISAVVDLPLTVTMANDSFIVTPVAVPVYVPQPIVVPQPQPVIPVPYNYPAYMPNNYNDMNPYGPHEPQNYANNHYQIMKRSINAASARHRYDIFTALSQSLDEFGIDGEACICKAICQLADVPMLIESPVHEIVEHILTVSQGYDEDSLLTQYIDAEQFGRSHGDCTKRFSSCTFSIFEKVVN